MAFREGFMDVLFGDKKMGGIELVEKIEKGLSFAAFERVGREFNLPLNELAEAVGISQRTLIRRKNEKRLSKSESDRLVSVSRLLAQAAELFDENREKTARWLHAPNRGLSGRTPLEMARI
jgi:putative toxin-antitoxin system antitoxin component (TIGR02293 family)